jgi:hypothetical protein
VAEPAVDAANTAPAPKPGWMREFWPTILAVAVILYAATPGAGVLLPLFVPVLLVWLPRMAWVAWRRPARRKAQGIKVLALVGAIVVAGLAHGRYDSRSRAQAQKVVDAVTAYHVQHGAYPDDLAQLGLDEQALRRDGDVRYLHIEDRHQVVYAAQFTVFDQYVYDFDKPGWVYKAGD